MWLGVTTSLFVLSISISPAVSQDAEDTRVNCLPDRDQDHQEKSLCISRGCSWIPPTEDVKAPSCFYPPEYGYRAVGEAVQTENGERVVLQKIGSQSMFGGDFIDVTVDIEFQTDTRLRVKVRPTNEARYEVPISIRGQDQRPENTLYKVEYTYLPVFSFKVVRKSNGQTIFDSKLGGLVLSDQFLQISGLLPSENIYGFAEHEQPSFKHDVNWVTWGMFARDHPPEGEANLYGVHPRYTVIEADGSTHGVLFLNSNAQDVTLTPAPGLVYRTTGGLLDIYFFMGPQPEAVVSQYTEAVGRYYLPPYWSLGFHLCRWGYNSLDNMRAAWQRTRDAGIPFDAQWGDIDYMDRRLDFTVNPNEFAGLQEFVETIHEAGMRFIPILDPAISSGEPSGSYPAFDDGDELEVWVRNSSGQPLVGQVWPDDPTYFPDFSNPVTQEWWVDQIVTFYDKLNFDGIWIDMNEPANFVVGSVDGCANNSLNYPPYKPHTDGPDLLQKTICLDAEQFWGSHYDTHSMYGWSETEPTLRGARLATGQRSLVLSRSTFVGSGRWTAHWLGDNWSEWDNLHFSIIGMMQFNQFGIPLVGADICGFIGNATEELCARWHQLGALYPFSRNHNVWDAYDQDPGVWEGGRVAAVAKASLELKYILLPYLYTLFYHHATSGHTVVRPLWHEFPTDVTTYDIDTQFMWGSSFIFAPIIEQGTSERQMYLPEGDLWYSGENLLRDKVNGWVTVVSDLDDGDQVPLFIRAGTIYPSHHSSSGNYETTTEAKKSPMDLRVTLRDDKTASGDLYLDDGESIDAEINNYSYIQFEAVPGSLNSKPITTTYTEFEFKIEIIWVFGLSDEDVTGVMVNNAEYADFEFFQSALHIRNLQLDPLTPFTIHWF